jgi:hypothetical protein
MGQVSQLRRTGGLPTELPIGKMGKLALPGKTGNCMPLSKNVPDVTAQRDQALRPSLRRLSAADDWDSDKNLRGLGSLAEADS